MTASDFTPDDHLTKLAVGALEPISREMWDRIEADLSDRDVAAIATAITKVAVECVRLGAIEIAAQVGESSAVQIDVKSSSDDYDMWAEKYGGDA
jgi:hypothetical protein